MSKTLLLGYSAFLFSVAGQLRIATVEKSAAVFVVTFLATDLVYYLYHRAMHEVRALWCFHLGHHSSPWMNLTTAGRLNWLSPLISLEGIVNTPSAHRVHHASNEQYLDKNYGGVLMVWDRLFGTYAVEAGPLRYGVTTGFEGHNPLWLVFGGFVNFARGRLASKG